MPIIVLTFDYVINTQVCPFRIYNFLTVIYTLVFITFIKVFNFKNYFYVFE